MFIKSKYALVLLTRAGRNTVVLLNVVNFIITAVRESNRKREIFRDIAPSN